MKMHYSSPSPPCAPACHFLPPVTDFNRSNRTKAHHKSFHSFSRHAIATSVHNQSPATLSIQLCTQILGISISHYASSSLSESPPVFTPSHAPKPQLNTDQKASTLGFRYALNCLIFDLPR